MQADLACDRTSVSLASTFWFTLPVRHADAGHDAAERSAT
jgi:hypothetical protein